MKHRSPTHLWQFNAVFGLVLVIVLLVSMAVLLGPTVARGSAVAPSDPIRVLSNYAADSDGGIALIAELEAWAGGSVAIEYESYGDVEELKAQVLGSDPPDVVIPPWPGVLKDLRADGALVDITQWVPRSELEGAFGEYLVEAAALGGSVVGIPTNSYLASLVWYVPATFATQGYAIPTTFEALVALSDEMVADGFTPWCNYMESSAATGWIGTDWVEDLLLSAEGGAVYDQWVDHDILFSDARVVTAFERFLSMINTPGYVFARGQMLTASFRENTFPLADGDCLMHKQKSFFPVFAGFDEANVSSFVFPPVSSAHKDATLGSGEYIAAVSSRPEVRDLIEHIVSDQWGTAALADAGFIIPNVDFDTSQYSDMQTRMWADRVHVAIGADLFRFDGSDLMPPEVGQGSFWQGIRDLVDGTKPLSTVLGEIDASWPVDDASYRVGLVNDNSGYWHLRHGDGGFTSFFYGNPGDVPFMGDWDCDTVATPGLFRTSDAFAYLRNSNTQGIADIRFFFGNPSDIPLAGDFNGDGCDTLSIYRPSEARFYIMNKLGENEGGLGAAEYSFLFGNPGDKPVVGDWDGDGIDEIGLHRETSGFFYYRNTLTTGIADGQFYFGDPGDRFVAGDWGIVDGKETPGVFRPSNSTFYFRHTLDQGNADHQFQWIGAGDWPPIAGPFGD